LRAGSQDDWCFSLAYSLLVCCESHFGVLSAHEFFVGRQAHFPLIQQAARRETEEHGTSEDLRVKGEKGQRRRARKEEGKLTAIM
jgi:hypothetical protein